MTKDLGCFTVAPKDTPDDNSAGPHVATQSQVGHHQDRNVCFVELWAGRYEILGELGAGANSSVHHVRDIKIGRELALKLLRVAAEGLVVREAYALTALESPHILRVFNAGIDNDVPFLATDIAAMGSTEDHLVEGVGVPPELAVRWVRQALIGLGLCHRKNILHRDLTPANIFLDSHDRALLGDFGAAENMESDGTAAAAGNQLCRAPEGYAGRVTASSDLFSAGVTLWRLLTGRWPFEASTEHELLALMSQGGLRLRDEAPHVHRSIARVVETALDPDPARRPPTADAMADLLAGTTTHARNWVCHLRDESTVEYRTTDGSSPISVAVAANGSGRIVTARYLKSDRRISDGCFETTERKLAQRLRVVFDKTIR